jgi:hypothetical protein
VRFVAIGLAIAALAAGLVAARYWYQSSVVKIDPAWQMEIRGPVDKNIMGWVSGVMIAFTTASRLNRKAALWTAASVVLGAVSAVIGAWPTSN